MRENMYRLGYSLAMAIPVAVVLLLILKIRKNNREIKRLEAEQREKESMKAADSGGKTAAGGSRTQAENGPSDKAAAEFTDNDKRDATDDSLETLIEPETKAKVPEESVKELNP